MSPSSRLQWSGQKDRCLELINLRNLFAWPAGGCAEELRCNSAAITCWCMDYSAGPGVVRQGKVRQKDDRIRDLRISRTQGSAMGTESRALWIARCEHGIISIILHNHTNYLQVFCISI